MPLYAAYTETLTDRMRWRYMGRRSTLRSAQLPLRKLLDPSSHGIARAGERSEPGLIRVAPVTCGLIKRRMHIGELGEKVV